MNIGTENVHAGRGNVHVDAGVGKRRLRVLVVRRRHRADIVQGRRILDGIALQKFVASRGDADNVFAVGVVNSLSHHVR